MEKPEIHSSRNQYKFLNCFYLLVVGTGSTRSSVHRFQNSKKYTVEVGQGNLKLTFSTDQGKMINYVNSRSLVCKVPDSSIIICYLKFMLTFSTSMNFFKILFS